VEVDIYEMLKSRIGALCNVFFMMSFDGTTFQIFFRIKFDWFRFWQKNHIIILTANIIPKRVVQKSFSYFNMSTTINDKMIPKPHYCYDLNFRQYQQDERKKIQNIFIDAVIESSTSESRKSNHKLFWSADSEGAWDYPINNNASCYSFKKLFVEDLDAEREIKLLSVLQRAVGYSEPKVLNLYDNYLKMKNFHQNVEDESTPGHNLPFKMDGMPAYYWCLTNHSLWVSGRQDEIMTVLKKECLIKVIYLVNTTEDVDQYIFENMQSPVQTLKIVKDKPDWCLPETLNCPMLSRLKCLKIGYPFYSSVNQNMDYDINVLTSFFKSWTSLQVLWIWGFTFKTVVESISQSNLALYEFKYSQTSSAIDDIIFQSDSVNVHSKDSDIFVSWLENQFVKFNAESINISIRVFNSMDFTVHF